MRDTHNSLFPPFFFFYLQTLNEYELVSELFEQAQPCMNSQSEIFLFIAFEGVSW